MSSHGLYGELASRVLIQAQCLPGGGRAPTHSRLGNSAALRDGVVWERCHPVLITAKLTGQHIIFWQHVKQLFCKLEGGLVVSLIKTFPVMWQEVGFRLPEVDCSKTQASPSIAQGDGQEHASSGTLRTPLGHYITFATMSSPMGLDP